MNGQQNNQGGNQYRRNTDSPVSGNRPPQRSAGRPQTNSQPVKRPQNAQSGMTPELAKQERRKKARKKMLLNNLKRIVLIMVIVIAVSTLIATVTISCINDVLPIHIPEKKDVSVSVVIQDGMNTSDVINALDDAGAIKNGWFCKLAAKVIGYSNEGYIARTYEFKRSMGLENMLNEIKNKTSKAAKTVTLTFPEGFTVDQIIDMLVENKVCARDSLISAMNTVDFSKEFDFLSGISDSGNRYMKCEGFLFPDTYDFYIGENAESVLRKFLTNFSKKWTDEYAEKAEAKNLTLDEVINLASIVEKEAASADMPTVASILLNRIDSNMRLECNSTSDYIKANKSGLTETQIIAYEEIYDTYICSSLPAGPICNPGATAIKAVLNAPDTNYYYFMHDVNNEMHIAKTLDEHNRNIANYGLAQ